MGGEALAHGETLGGKYLVDGYLGGGGIGEVYRATHTWTGRPVALKVLRPHYAQEPNVVQRFFSEAKLTARLKHPNVVDVLDMGSEGKTVYLVLECLVGTSLADHLKHVGRIDVAETQRVLIPIMEALDVAHRAGVVHRDLKPDNIFLHRDETGRSVPKLLDFGLAKVAQLSRSGLTVAGSVLGTPHYMSPEQAQGATDAVGPPADVWAISVTLYECLAGECPFGGETAREVLVNIVMGNHAPLRSHVSVTEEVEKLIGRGLRAAPEDRWRMGELARAFGAIDARKAATDSWVFAPTEYALEDERSTGPGSDPVDSGGAAHPAPAVEPSIEAPSPMSTSESVALPAARGMGLWGIVAIVLLVGLGGLAAGYYFVLQTPAGTTGEDAETPPAEPPEASAGAATEAEEEPPTASELDETEASTEEDAEEGVSPQPAMVATPAPQPRRRHRGRAMARRPMNEAQPPSMVEPPPQMQTSAMMGVVIPSLERDWE